MRPNLFAYATKELSQDAFLCWLLAWADRSNEDADPALHRLGLALLNALLAKHGDTGRARPKVEVHKQIANMDIVAFVDDDAALLIEDKVHSSEHGDQLARYRAQVEMEHASRRCMPIYLQTGAQGNYSKVESAGYRTFLRKELIQVLQSVANARKNAIVADFLANLERHDRRVESWQTAPLRDWIKDYFPWIGFYEWLRDQSRDAEFSWHYVANPSGGFLGAWWHFQPFLEKSVLYLQVEQTRLCVKLGAEDVSAESDLRWIRAQAGELVERAAAELGLVIEPTRKRIAAYMTVAVVPSGAWLIPDSGGLLDRSATWGVLNRAKEAVSQAASREPINGRVG
jgi:hypothetical protein